MTTKKNGTAQANPFAYTNADGTFTAPSCLLQELFQDPRSYMRALGATAFMLLMSTTNGELTIGPDDADLLNVMYTGLAELDQMQSEFVTSEIEEVQP